MFLRAAESRTSKAKLRINPSADREIRSGNELIIDLCKPGVYLCKSFGNHGNTSAQVFSLI